MSTGFSSSSGGTGTAVAARTVVTGGVADYYAILGVGDKLTWKHAQKKSGSHAEGNDLEKNDNERTEQEEETRFLREIVHVTVVAGSSTLGGAEEESLVSEISERRQQRPNSHHYHSGENHTGPIPMNPSFLSDASSNIDPSVVSGTWNAASAGQHRYAQHETSCHPDQLLQSPSCLSDATAMTSNHRNNNVVVTGDTPLASCRGSRPGWSRIQCTLPTSKVGYGFSSSASATKTHQGFQSKGSDDEDANSDQCPILWKKNAVFDANLDFADGIRADIQARQLQFEGRIFPPSNHQHMTGSSSVAAPPGTLDSSTNSTNKPTVGAGLRRKMKTTLQTFQQQLRPNSNYDNKRTDGQGPVSHDHEQNFQLNIKGDNPLQHSSFFVEFQRRRCALNECNDLPAIADIELCYVRLHWESIPSMFRPSHQFNHHHAKEQSTQPTSPPDSSGANNSLPGFANQILERYQNRVGSPTKTSPVKTPHDADNGETSEAEEEETDGHGRLVPLEDYLELPKDFDEWSIPAEYRWIRDPHKTLINISKRPTPQQASSFRRKTVIIDQHDVNNFETSSNVSGEGIEAIRAISPTYSSPASSPIMASGGGSGTVTIGPEQLVPRLMTSAKSDYRVLDDYDNHHRRHHPRPLASNAEVEDDDELYQSMHRRYYFIPVLAVRRQRVGDEERYHEDSAVVDLAVSFCDRNADPALPDENLRDPEDVDDDDEDEGTFRLLGKTSWLSSAANASNNLPGPMQRSVPRQRRRKLLGMPVLLVRKNLPFGFADAAFATQVLGRFPFKNYKGLPLPEEELPMFCYPTGCRLHRTRFSDAPLPHYYGFVVKNERGDSIHVSCVSFFEPLTSQKVKQLAHMSEKRRNTSLPHRIFCESNERRKHDRDNLKRDHSLSVANSISSSASTEADSNFLLTSFDDMTTFENKTICLIGRYPFWTAFRKFLSHLHLISGSPSELPIERWISHLLLAIPLPRPGGPNILIPLPALNEPMVLSLPPEKDLPLVDLPYHRLFACLEIRTVVTTVLGLLALERKVIVLSTRPSLVLDVCELLKSLLFPFDLCAPYVPRLTEPFKTSLDFPGAIFVGIHDDGSPNGLAAIVKTTLPEDSIIIDLDTGDVDCDGDRYAVISKAWDIIPESSRSILVSELETLCRDAKIADGQEPLDSLMDSAFHISLPDAIDHYGHADEGRNNGSFEAREPLDDRAVRDAFLRFFCSVLGGYERYLVVPDADFLVSGNEWFDSQGFLASVPTEKAPYLGALVSTQLFQSFIQRRTEASDVQCLLFDECLVEYHSSPMPYGRLGGDVENVHSAGNSQPHMIYSLLVDQSAALPSSSDQTAIMANRSMDASEADSSFSFNASKASACYTDVSSLKYSEFIVNVAGDLVSAPSRQGLQSRHRFVYFVDGNPCFPHKLKSDLLLPKEPESWLLEMSKSPNPLLARSERELEEANRRRKIATSHRGMQNNRRCLWQLPKLMGSHFLGSWLICTPALVSQPHISHDSQSRYILRALGALRLLRSKQRIVPDEAAYRALMVACGRTRSDRRVELVKLFGLLRSDGIFPSAVTLGQYTKSLAEGYSKRSSGAVQDEDFGGVEVTESGSRVGRYSIISLGQQKSLDLESSLNSLDPSLSILESHGKRWRQKGSVVDNRRNGPSKSWYPVAFSSSFQPSSSDDSGNLNNIRLLAIWSRTRGCPNCSYILLDEEIQAGWDVLGGHSDIPDAVACPRCGSMVVPMLGYREVSIEEASALDSSPAAANKLSSSIADYGNLPPQIGPSINSCSDVSDRVSYVTYVSPAALRLSLEQYVEALGEEVLERDRLMEMDPEVLINFWWYCARFSLPLPLPVKPTGMQYCTFAAWDRSVAERGCYSASRVLSPLLASTSKCLDGETSSSEDTLVNNEMYEEYPLLSRFNLQGFYSTVWDHKDLSKLLVTLVEACDKRDFKPVIETIVQCNYRRRQEFNNATHFDASSGEGLVIRNRSDAETAFLHMVEFDAYRTILYLAKYQCTTAFHTFFPSTLKPCKGYHFWCAMGTPMPIFDRLLRDGIKRFQKSSNSSSTNKDHGAIVATPIHTVSDVALGFRCVFGHLI